MNDFDTKTESAIHETTIRSLYESSLFRQAFDYATQQFGEVSHWPTTELQLLGARILGQLGLDRKSDAIIYRLWRKAPELSGLASYYVTTVYRWKGPLQAFDTITLLRSTYELAPEDLTQLLIEEANIYAHYRDYSAAESCLEEIPKGSKDHWVEFCFADLKFQQDNYSEALGLFNTLLSNVPSLRSALQKKAHVLQLLGRNDEAIDLLKQFWDTSESWWVGRQLFDLLLENKRFTEAESCLDQLEKLPPLPGKEITQRHNVMRADLFCAQEKYDAALPYLKTKSFFHSAIKKSIETATGHSGRCVLDVPFVRQAHMTCAPASLCAVSQYWGTSENQDEVVQAICYGGTQSFDERRWAEEKNWYCCEFDLRFNALKMLIDAGIPVLLSTVEPGSAHLQVIVGYNEKMGTYLLRDPYHPRLQEFLITECEKYYAADGPRCMVLAPQERQKDIEDFKLPSKANYDLLYKLNAALSKNQRTQAKQCVDYARKNAPNHRVTLLCERTLALYDHDESAILAATEAMLKRFPDNVNYQLSKVASLQRLGPHKDALNYLESIASDRYSHFLIRSRFADEIRWDHRETARTDKLYQDLLRVSPLHAKTLYGYAGTLWDKGEYARSYLMYRFCACLEDTNEVYAESFFKAALYHKETDAALAFLADRFKRFGRQSSGPAISLFNALDSLERPIEAMTYIEQAIELRPDDGHLLLFAVRKQLYLNDNRAIELLKRAKPFVSDVRFNETAMEVYEARLDIEKAEQACRTILNIEPLNYYANNTLARYLTQQGKRNEALEHLHTQLAQFPGNDTLQRFIIDWIDPNDKDALLLAFQEYARIHPNDAWGMRGLANALVEVQKFQEALTVALEAVKIRASECANYGCLGDVYRALNQLGKAHDAYRQAISLSCDYTYAYSKLLETSRSTSDQKNNLEFIHDELMKQVSYGQGILDFQYTAKQYLSAEPIREFLFTAKKIRPDLWQSWVALVIQLRFENRCEEALNYIDEAIERFPLLPRVHFEKSETLRVLHRDEEAIAVLKQTLALSPGWTSASNNLCSLYENKGDLEPAIKLQEEAIRRSPLSASPYGYLADLLSRVDRKAEALIAIEKAIERDVHYQWAWSQYSDLKKDVGEHNEVMTKLNEYIVRQPESTELINIFIELSSDDKASEDLIKKYLSIHPNHHNLTIKLIHLYASQRKFAEASRYVSPEYWGGEPPIAIEANGAWLLHQQDNVTAAIRTMETVVEKAPNYYDGWRFLAKWYCGVKNSDGVTKAVEQCARLYPHDSNVLCYCAEQLEKVDGDVEKISELLKRAFELDTTNQYIGLTYIDHALKQDRLDDASTALELLSYHCKNPYIYLRSLELAIKRNDAQKTLSHFVQCIDDFGDANNIIIHMWRLLNSNELRSQAADAIRAKLDITANLNPYAGRCLASFELAQMSLSKFEKKLLLEFKKHDYTGDFHHRYLEAYLRHLIVKKRDIPQKIERKLTSTIKQDALNWGVAGYLKFTLKDGENNAAKFFDGIQHCQDAHAWTLYYASMACRWSGRWHLGEEMINAAYLCPADDLRSDILAWRIVDNLLAENEIDCAPLEHLHLSELEPMSHYTLATAKALASLRSTNFVDSFADLSPLLRECQFQIQKHPGNRITSALKNRLRMSYKKNFPDLPIFKHILWTWRLSNHF